MKYVSIPEFVTAEIYRPGLEDGFGGCDSLTCGVFNRFDSECSSCRCGVPYIDTWEGSIAIYDGDFIVTHADNSRTVMSSEEFHKKYKCVLS